jgi:hypothetical protein
MTGVGVSDIAVYPSISSLAKTPKLKIVVSFSPRYCWRLNYPVY